MRRSDAHPYALRTVNPSAWPQYPYDEVPRTPERSQPVYEIYDEWDIELRMRDGVSLLLDIYRPRRPGVKFPALHRAVDRVQSRLNEPWHPHAGREPLAPGTPVELEIGIVATCNVFATGHRIRLELSNCDSTVRPGAMAGYRKVLRLPARNTVLTGPAGSRVSLPVIPR